MTNEPITDAQLAEWERIADAATPGPWHPYERTSKCGRAQFTSCGVSTRATSEDPYNVATCHSPLPRLSEWYTGVVPADLANARLIATARTVVPALIAEVRRLRKEVVRLRAELKKARYNPSLDQALNEGDGTYRP